MLEVYCEWLMGSAYWEPLLGVHCGQVMSASHRQQWARGSCYEHYGCKDVGWAVLVVVRFLELESVGFVWIASRCGMDIELVLRVHFPG